ncbi:MAG: hypothetical protein A2Y62_17160 [Candidatus Fischerbacteria bacterium RBG_13_37_8]|uniref:PASTA domain-containing protein n=1 Tax=Candidatus Fischerbacteria bacterium RBG_13_37_8 TaxID=1817863 RepID=A0A1F5VG04_9BACT|nr:MAG: hypothetical protein A2Y62_17160 [Candidatus Fischerbacteria bacterium RBG_13_37_8]
MSHYSKIIFFYRKRFVIVLLIILIWFLLVFARLVQLQVIQSKEYGELAKKQQYWEIELNPLRGDISDRNGERLAVSINSYSLYIMPKEIDNPVRTSLILSSLLPLSANEILKKITSNDSFFWLKRKVDSEIVEAVMQKKLPGIYSIEESSRYYPGKDLAAHAVGFVGTDNIGLEGTELYYDRALKGEQSKVIILKDAASKDVMVHGEPIEGKMKGSDLFLTIYSELQYIVEEELEIWVKEHNAKRGTAIIMNPENGEIYAMASYPAYDLNRFTESPAENRRNLATQLEFEPGSIFKVIVAAAALGEKKVSPKDIFDCENGKIMLSGFVIRDHKPFGLLNFEEIIKNSSNVGAIKVGMKVGKAKLYEYIQKFGIGEKTDIDLYGESSGYVRPLSDWSGLSIGALSIGQEVFTTPLQMLRVVSIIANGGYFVKPHLGYKTVASDGTVKYLNKEKLNNENVLDESTLAILRSFLRGVVVDGTGKLAELEGYGVSGKTGTAQKIGPSHTYADGGLIASFMGYFPFHRPRVAMLVIIDEPKGIFWGSQVAAPLFSRIARKTAEHLRIPPAEPLYLAYLKGKNNKEEPVTTAHTFKQEINTPGGLPDFRGMSLDEAIVLIEKLKLPCKFIGYGKVIAQVPEPGFPLNMTSGVIVYLDSKES